MRYEVGVGERRLRIESSPEGRLIVDGRVVAYDAREIGPRHWSVVVEGRAHEVVLLGGDPSLFARGGIRLPSGRERALVDGVEVRLAVADERALAARSDRARAGGDRHEVRAPMPGLLKAVHVAEGDIVEQNAPLATLEAMKMENELRAPSRARVQRVAAAAGTKVESGSLIAVLVEELG